MKWQLEKFTDMNDMFIMCPKCRFSHHTKKALLTITLSQYQYCPQCGEYLSTNHNEEDTIWHKRSFVDYVFDKKEKNK